MSTLSNLAYLLEAPQIAPETQQVRMMGTPELDIQPIFEVVRRPKTIGRGNTMVEQDTQSRDLTIT